MCICLFRFPKKPRVAMRDDLANHEIQREHWNAVDQKHQEIMAFGEWYHRSIWNSHIGLKEWALEEGLSIHIQKKHQKQKKTVKKKATKQTPVWQKTYNKIKLKKKQGSRCLCFFFSRLRERTEPRRGPGHLVPTCKGPSRSLWMQREQWLYPRVTGWGEVTVEVELGGSLYNTHTRCCFVGKLLDFLF